MVWLSIEKTVLLKLINNFIKKSVSEKENLFFLRYRLLTGNLAIIFYLNTYLFNSGLIFLYISFPCSPNNLTTLLCSSPGVIPKSTHLLTESICVSDALDTM